MTLSSNLSSCIPTLLLATFLGSGFGSANAQQLDETWTLTVNGQSVQADDDGSFRIPGITAPDCTVSAAQAPTPIPSATISSG